MSSLPKPYEENILPEEVHHHWMGREHLERRARTAGRQRRTTIAARTISAIADEARHLA